MDKVGCDANAQVLTSIMKTVLDQLDELACRVVQKKEEIEYMIIHVMDAVLQASIAVEPLCEDNLAAKAINKSMIETAMSDLQFYKKLHSKGREETFTETELKQAEEEANRARKIYREIEKEEMMQDGEK